MQREREKRRKAEEKRKRRLERKAVQANVAPEPDHEVSNGSETIQNDQSAIKDETGDDLSISDD